MKELAGIKKGIRIGARHGKVFAFIENLESASPEHSGAEGVGVDSKGKCLRRSRSSSDAQTARQTIISALLAGFSDPSATTTSVESGAGWVLAGGAKTMSDPGVTPA
jgi:hypothetical protein